MAFPYSRFAGCLSSIAGKAQPLHRRQFSYIQNILDIEFDPEKDAANLAKHGVSLKQAAELDVVIFMPDARFSEPRFRAYGLLRGEVYCLAYVIRGSTLRAISLRRARAKEYRRYGL